MTIYVYDMVEHPYILVGYAVFLIILFFLVRKNFIKFSSDSERNNYTSQKKPLRKFIFVSRLLIFLMLALAISSPFITKDIVVKGDPSVTLLVDNSTSMQVFDTNSANNLKSTLEQNGIPVNIEYISVGDVSAIGDSLLNNMNGNDNLLLLSDGNNNEGRDLGDVVLFASTLNSSISMINLKPENSDTYVSIEGPNKIITDVEYTFEIPVTVVGTSNYKVALIVDGKKVFEEEGSSTKTYEFKTRFKEGFHKFAAKVTIADGSKDYFGQNNEFFKTVEAIPKPNLLYISTGETPLSKYLSKIYNVDMRNMLDIPIIDLKKYHLILIDNQPSEKMEKYVDLIAAEVEEGTGLFVVGGKNSFDKSYSGSKFESILPVTSLGDKSKTQDDINLVFAVDISGSTGTKISSGDSKVDFEKALAIEIINDLRKYDNVAVIAFNAEAFLVSELTPLASKPELTDTIAHLKNGGGTYIYTALEMALDVLKDAKGNKNVILITDGWDNYRQKAISTAQALSANGIKLYAVGVGRGTHTVFMEELVAAAGTNLYFEPDETQKLALIFGDEGGGSGELSIINDDHFITQGVSMETKIIGYNDVQPKPAANMLLMTKDKHPILTVWRFGLGRVAVLSTDSGRDWGNPLFQGENTDVLLKTVNWVIGNAQRKEDFSIFLEDSNLGEEARIQVFAKTIPKSDEFIFYKISEDKYETQFVPDTQGFYQVLNGYTAVNYNKEYARLGMNPELQVIVEASGGASLDIEQTNEIVDKIIESSRKLVVAKVYYRWPFIIAAIIIFLIELGYRTARALKKKL